MTTYTADRKGHVTENDSFQDRFLEKMYGSAIGRALLKPLVNPVLSEIGGRILDSRVSALAVPAFIRHAGIDMRDYEPKKYWSYNDFFTRRLKEGQRPVAEDESLLVSPCDSNLKQHTCQMYPFLSNNTTCHYYTPQTSLLLHLMSKRIPNLFLKSMNSSRYLSPFTTPTASACRLPIRSA